MEPLHLIAIALAFFSLGVVFGILMTERQLGDEIDRLKALLLIYRPKV